MLTITATTAAGAATTVEINTRGSFGVERDVPQHIVDGITADVAEGFTFGRKYDQDTLEGFSWRTTD